MIKSIMIKRGLILILLTVFTKQFNHPKDNDWFKCLEKFDGFIKKFDKHYDEEDKQFKIKTFYENFLALKKISKPHDYKVGINSFADISWEEFQRDYLMHIDVPKELQDFKISHPEDFHYASELLDFKKKDLQKKTDEKFKNAFSEDFWGESKKHKCSCHRFLQAYSWSPHHNSSNYQTYNHNQSYPLNNRYHYNRTHTPYRSSPSSSYGYTPTTHSNTYNQNPYNSQRYNHSNHSNYNNHSNHYNNNRSNHNRYTPNNYSHHHNSQNGRQRHQHNKKRRRMDPLLKSFPKRKTWEYSASPVKNQQKCAACYAFAALAAVELQAQKRGEYSPPLSEQEIIDCSRENNGCVGGSPFKVFKYINDNNGISYLGDYPYSGVKNRQCMRRQLGNRRRFNKRLNYFFVRNPVELIVALNRGPAVVIQHVNRNFKRYTGGIFDDKYCNGKINHAALAVGYDLTGPVPYIKCKNEWGSGWGMRGYYKIALGDLTRNSKGICKMFSHSGTVVPTLGY